MVSLGFPHKHELSEDLKVLVATRDLFGCQKVAEVVAHKKNLENRAQRKGGIDHK